MSFITQNLRVQYQWNDTSGPGLTWTTITDYLTAFKISRQHKSAGSLNVSLINDTLDPSTHPGNDQHIRKGQLARVQVLVAGNWKNIWAGTIKKVDTTFNSTATSVVGTRVVNFTGFDHIHKRKQKQHSHGVGKSDDLRAYIDPPYIINGLTTSKSSVGVDTYEHDNTSEWDQILITRDTEQGSAYVNKDDVLVVNTRANQTTAVKATITNANYSKVDLNYTIENVINEVVIKEIRKYKNGKTHVVHKGVFTSQSSIDKYGQFRAVYTVQAQAATWGDDVTYANNILDNNADPEIVPTGCAIPIVTTSDVANFLDAVDITDKITINVDGTIYSARVNTITVESDGVLLGVAFTLVHPEIVYKPVKKLGTGVSNVTDGQVETEHMDDKAITTAKIDDLAVTTAQLADRAVTIDKVPTSFFTDIGGHGFTTAPTAPSAPTAGDYWVDTTNGNVLKNYNGTSWVSIQDTAIATAQAAATAAQTTANGKNRVTYSTSTPGTTSNTVGDLWFQTSGTTIIGQWQGNGGTSWTQVTLTDTVISTLDAGKITTGILDANRIGVDTITADKMVIGVGSNAIANPGVESGTTVPHVLSSATSMTANTGAPRSGTYGLRIVCPTRTVGGLLVVFNGQPTNTGIHLPVAQGDQVHAEFWARAGAVNGQNAIIYADIRDATGAHIAYGPTQTVTMTSIYQKMSSDLTITQANAAYVCLAIGSSACTAGDVIWVDDVVLLKKTDGSLIVDGSITANLIGANAIVAGKVAAGAIDGLTITGAILQTASGAGQRILLRNDGSGGVLEFYGGVSGETSGKIDPSYYTDGSGFIMPSLVIKPGYTSAVSVFPRITMQPGGLTSHGFVPAYIELNAPTGNVAGLISINGQISSDDLIETTGQLQGAKVFAISPDSSTGSANVRFNANNQLTLATSLSKYKLKKQKVKLAELDKILQLEPTSWYDKWEYDENGRKTDGLQRYVGLLSEEVEALVPQLSEYRDGKLQGIAYDRIAVLLIPILRRLEERVTELETIAK